MADNRDDVVVGGTGIGVSELAGICVGVSTSTNDAEGVASAAVAVGGGDADGGC